MKKILLLMCAAILLSGCGKSDERNHPLFQKGKRAQSVGNGEEAAEFFHKFLARRPDSVYVHLQLATVYDELLDEPLTAAYHYRQYLRLVPDAPDAEEVRSWLKILITLRRVRRHIILPVLLVLHMPLQLIRQLSAQFLIARIQVI